MIWLPGILSQGGKKGISENFADNDWETIIAACQNNEVPDTWIVGDQKAMTIGGAEYLIDIIGKAHDHYTAGGTAPLTLQLHQLYSTKYDMNYDSSNLGGWKDCEMRSIYLPNVLDAMPSTVKSSIKAVNKKASEGGQSSTVNTVSDKLFLLSEIEVRGSIVYSYSGEGAQYAYYTQGSYGNRPKYDLSGALQNRWLRSPDKDSSDSFCYVMGNYNGAAKTGKAHLSYHVAPAFCF